jgi:hypothetical protein
LLRTPGDHPATAAACRTCQRRPRSPVGSVGPCHRSRPARESAANRHHRRSAGRDEILVVEIVGEAAGREPKEDATLSATGYLLSQEEFIRGLEFLPEAFSYGAYRTYQVPIAQIETLTQLSFGALSNADPLAKLEAASAGREVSRPEELVL